MPKIRWSTLAILTALLLALTLWPAGAGAQATCGPSHDSAVSAITGAQLGQGIERKLVTKVDNAWRMFQAGGKNGLKNALHQLDVALRLLDSPATKQIPPQTRDAVRHAIEDFQTCLVGGPPAETATLTVHTFLPSDASPDGKGDPAGAGVLVIVDGLELGVTGSDGVATVEVPAGTITVEARLYPSNVGTAEVTLAAGQSGQVDIILDEGKEPAEPTDLVLDESVDGVLPQAFSTFTLRFVKADDTTVQLSHLDEVELLDPNGGSSIFLQSQFALQPNGTVTATNPAALSSLFQARSGAIEMRMHGTDATGRTHDNLVRFYLSRFQVSGRLVAPPSFPGLDTSGIFITATILNTPLVFHAVSDGSGNFSFPLLPSGNLEIHSETFQNGKYYYGQGIAVLNRNLSVVVTMLYTDDLINGVPGFSVTSLLAAPKASTAPRLPFPAGSGSSTLGKDLLSPLAAAPASVSVNVTAGPQNVPITSAVTFNILKGT
ncbi:MAG TPA: hypothetical protein VFR03_11920, partial [Thermoanaerobaculia bacterium]|nr:hypothetical protein [Thermoanaerobaculia bacterium]